MRYCALHFSIWNKCSLEQIHSNFGRYKCKSFDDFGHAGHFFFLILTFRKCKSIKCHLYCVLPYTGIVHWFGSSKITSCACPQAITNSNISGNRIAKIATMECPQASALEVIGLINMWNVLQIHLVPRFSTFDLTREVYSILSVWFFCTLHFSGRCVREPQFRPIISR